MTQNPFCPAPFWIQVCPLLILPFIFFFSFFLLSFTSVFTYVCPELENFELKLNLISGPESFLIFNYPLSSSSGVFSFFLLPRAGIWINPNAWFMIIWHSPPYGEYFKSYLPYFLGINLHLSIFLAAVNPWCPLSHLLPLMGLIIPASPLVYTSRLILSFRHVGFSSFMDKF